MVKTKQKPKKSNHKHEYELRPLDEPKWFTHEQVCTICGHVYTLKRIRV